MKDSRICTNQKLYRWNTCLNQNRLWSLLASVLKHRGLETPSLCAAMWPLCLLSGCCNVISIDSAIHMSCQNLSGEAVPFVCGLRAASCQLLCVQNGKQAFCKLLQCLQRGPDTFEGDWHLPPLCQPHSAGVGQTTTYTHLLFPGFAQLLPHLDQDYK